MADPNTIYSGSDNPLVLTFTLNGVPQTLETATKITVDVPVANVSYNTLANPGMFDLTQVTAGIVALNLSTATIADGIYNLRVIVIDPSHPDGVVWCHEKDEYPTQLKFVNLT